MYALLNYQSPLNSRFIMTIKKYEYQKNHPKTSKLISFILSKPTLMSVYNKSEQIIY